MLRNFLSTVFRNRRGGGGELIAREQNECFSNSQAAAAEAKIKKFYNDSYASRPPPRPTDRRKDLP
jgi:hypothetical protein